MTAQAQQHALQKLDDEILGFERALVGARNVGEEREIRDRLTHLRLVRDRVLDGKLTANQ